MSESQPLDHWDKRAYFKPPRPPAPPAPPAPPSPPAPPAPPVPPAPPPLGPVSPQLTSNQPVLTLLLPSAFDEYLSEPESNKAQDEYVEVEHFPAGRWGQPDDCPWDESEVGADDDVADAEEASGADGAEGGTEASARGGARGDTADDVFPEGVTGDADDDGVEYWSCDGLPEKLPIPTYPPNNRKRPHPSSQNRDARPPSPIHKLTDHKRQGYTAAEKLKRVALMDLAVSVRALARESGIHRQCLTNRKRTAEFLKDVHSARKRMHGRGRASWYRPMELKVTGDSGAAAGAEPWGADSGGAVRGGAEPGGATAGGAGPAGATAEGAEPGGAEPGGAVPGDAGSGGAGSGAAEPGGATSGGAGSGAAAPGVSPTAASRREPLSPRELREWFARRWRRAAESGGAAGAGAGASSTVEGAGAAGPGAAGPAGPPGAGAAEGVGAAPTTVGPPAGGVGGPGTVAEGTGAVPAESGAAARPRPYFVPLLQQVLGLSPPVESPPPAQSQSLLEPSSSLPAPSPYTGPTGGLAERREPASRPASPVRAARASGRSSRQRPPPVPGTHRMSLRPSTAALRAPLPSPPESSLPALADPASDSLRAASPAVPRLLATVVTDPSFESAAASALVAELVDFAARCRLDYAASLVAESASVCPPSVGGLHLYQSFLSHFHSCSLVSHKRRERGIDTAWIINADQTPLWLEMPATTTVEETGVRSVPIRSAGYQKQRVTVMLACTADGRKLKPWVFFKRKTLPKGDFPADVAVACHENGWMDSAGVVRWLEEGVKPFLKPRFGRHAKSSMLVLDSYRGHLTEEVKEKLREMNCVPGIIPSGCTAEVQPLDVCINKSFKASVRQ
ncbi:unnamed protein product [Closterium sp. NIES-54]